MRTWLVLCLGLAFVAGCRRHSDAQDPRTVDPASRRTTPSGDVVGFVGRYGSHVWMGLPYAAPPVGDLRWRGPVPPAAWQGVREALRPGSPCLQYASPLGGIQTAPPNTPVGDEDCLYLNVYAPRTATPTSLLPVMVWIHGGGNTIGAGDLYDGGNLAATRNVVVITLNYRLGPFGWFRNAGLRVDAMSDPERSGNFGTLDLVRALEWVQSNVAAFGGDPVRVTIFGESAGGTNVASLLLSPSAVGLFHRAIIESGGLHVSDPNAAEAFDDTASPETANSSNEAVTRLLIATHAARDRADAKAQIAATPRAGLVSRLRAASARDVLAAYTPLPGIGMIPMPTVFRDDTVIPSGDLLGQLRRSEGWNRVPVLVGTNRDENKTFMYASPQWIRRWFGIIPRMIEPPTYDLVAESLSTMWKATGADEIAGAIVASGFRDVYVYRFDWRDEPTILGTDLSRMLGAGHGLEIPFVFGHFDLGREANRIFTADNEPGRTKLASAMMSYWAAFATSGAPGRGDGTQPAWPAWGDGHEFMVLDAGAIERASSDLTRESVLDSIATDARLSDPRLRCLVYHDLVLWSPSLSREAYDAKCPTFAFDAYPWRS